MGYNVDFKVKVQDLEQYVSIHECIANITSNVKELIFHATDYEWKINENNGYVKDIIPHIEKGLYNLTNKPNEYKKYELVNGWGTVDGVIDFFETILYDWKKCKKWKSKELIEVITFWIE